MTIISVFETLTLMIAFAMLVASELQKSLKENNVIPLFVKRCRDWFAWVDVSEVQEGRVVKKYFKMLQLRGE